MLFLATDAPVTTTTTTFAPCADCCDAKEIIIPGTGETTVVPPIKKGETEFIDCPAGFEGRIKMHCMQGDEQYLDDPRLFDGYCLPSNLIHLFHKKWCQISKIRWNFDGI